MSPTVNAVGKNISAVEVSNISQHGIWLLVKGKEYFLPYREFPWFRTAKISQIFDVQLNHSHHLHWPALDVDLELKSLENLENYPLVYS
jgi:hypothetical protein